MDVRKVLSSFVVSAIILASFVGVCKQMLVSCGVDCTQQAMSTMQMDHGMSDCAQDATTCLASVKDHMATFASLYPSVTTEISSLLIFAGFVVLAWFLVPNGHRESIVKLCIRLRSLKRRISSFVAPDFLVFAFSKGILNSKIFA